MQPNPFGVTGHSFRFGRNDFRKQYAEIMRLARHQAARSPSKGNAGRPTDKRMMDAANSITAEIIVSRIMERFGWASDGPDFNCYVGDFKHSVDLIAIDENELYNIEVKFASVLGDSVSWVIPVHSEERWNTLSDETVLALTRIDGLDWKDSKLQMEPEITGEVFFIKKKHATEILDSPIGREMQKIGAKAVYKSDLKKLQHHFV